MPVLIEDLGSYFPNETAKHKIHFAMYECKCGTTFKARVGNVNSGATSSCGCFKRQSNTKRLTTHGMTGSKLFKVLASIRRRTTNEKSANFKYYGGRGITLCKEWDESPELFYLWAIKTGYTAGLSIDRIDNDGNYSPDNCRWTNKNIQSQNTRVIRSNNTSGYRGVSWHKNMKVWLAQIMIEGKQKHIGSFKDILLAAEAYDSYVINNNLEHTKNFS